MFIYIIYIYMVNSALDKLIIKNITQCIST